METATPPPRTGAATSNVYNTCHNETAVRFDDAPRRGARHRLRSPDHIELHRSRLVRSPLARLVLWVVETFDALRDGLTRLMRTIFPRRARIYGRRPNSEVIGRLVFGQKLDDLNQPIHHMHVELWGRAFWGGWRKLGQDISDHDGYFRIPFDLRAARHWWMRRIWFEVYHTGNHRYVDGKPVNDFIRFTRRRIRKSDLVGIEYDLGRQQLFYWEYRHDTPVPRVVVRDHDEDAPERYSRGRIEALERQLVPIELIKMKHLDEIRMAPGVLTLDKIQADYPRNLTQCMEARQPHITRGDDWFGERMMNGMYAAEFDRDPQNPDLLWVHYHWNSYDRNIEYAMPDVDIRFRLKPDGLPLPVSITLTGPLNAYELDQRPRRTFTPGDGPHWLAAKRLARVSGAIYTELAHHFAGTHVNTEQYSIAAHRHLRLSPLTTLLFPHLKEVTLVDHTADRILVGNGYITQACALTPRGINQVVEKVMGTLDWKNWRPLQPISEAHTYARAANLYWDIVSRYVDEFIDQNAEGIKTCWHELFRFSEDAVRHSVPVFLCSYLQRALLDENKHPRPAGPDDWYRRESRMDLFAKFPGAVRHAVSPITQARFGNEATPQDWADLKQACAYIIFQATFGHSWANSKQYDDIGEVRYNCLGLRFGDGPEGVLAGEDDGRIAPDLTRSTQMMWWSNILSRTGYGFLVKNEDGDINPRLIEALKAHKDQFEAFDFPIENIQSRTNI